MPAPDSACVSIAREHSTCARNVRDLTSSTRASFRSLPLDAHPMDDATPASPASGSTQPAASASEVSSRGRKRKAVSYAEAEEGGRGQARRTNHEQQDGGTSNLAKSEIHQLRLISRR